MDPAEKRGASLSVVVVAYDMAREIVRTLRSLEASYQRGLGVDDYEIVIVDNGSPEPLDDTMLRSFEGRLRSVRIDQARPSPAEAANRGLALAEGEIVGLVIDGARITSPGLLATARRAAGLASRPVITAPAWHLGSVVHKRATEVGYDQAVEDALLADCEWESDGYRLFEVSTLAGSSARGIFGPMGESSSLFMPRSLWAELGGLDEQFSLPGGGLVNHDLYRRACELDGVELIVLLGEGTFHQYHGGASTSRRLSWEEMHAQYMELRGREHRPPDNEPLFAGGAPDPYLIHVEQSARRAINRLEKRKQQPEARPNAPY